MVLVFILCTIIIIISIIVCMIILSTIRLKINNFESSNIKEIDKNIGKKYKVTISLYLFNKIKWFSIRLNDKKIREMYGKFKLEQIDINKIKQDFRIKDLKQIKKVKLQVSYLELDLKMGLEDAILTSFAVFLISTIISIALPYVIKKYEKDKYNYKIVPLYINQNVYEIKFNCIIETKMVHIINIIYYFFKKRRVKNYEQRASNRRSYGYSYE